MIPRVAPQPYAVGQRVPVNVVRCAHLPQEGQRAGAASGQKQIAVRMHPAGKFEIAAGKIAQVALRQHAKLKYGNQRHLHAALHLDLLTARPVGAGPQRQRQNSRQQPGIRAC